MTASLHDQLQTSLGASYTLERELGGGGMARVFLAEETALGRAVVIKVLAPELAEGLSAERFAREIRLAARLQHPNIIPLHSAGTSDGLPYYTMPFVRGDSLRARIAGGPLDVSTAVRVLGDVARALAYAHTEGVVHRDVKPENILLSGDVAVVADFGIAKAVDAARTQAPGATLTQVGIQIGTPAYMAPEQAVGDVNVDARADVYAWGVIAYELFTGQHPFAGKGSTQAMIVAHVVEEPAPLSRARTNLPRPLGALVMRCLAKDPLERPADGRALSELLDAIAATGLGTPREAPADDDVTPSAAAPRAIVVLPMVNTSGDPENEHFSDGLTDELIGALSGVASLRVTGRTSSFALKGKGLSLADIARTLGVESLLEGSVRRAGSRLKARVQLVNADGKVLWSEAFDRTLTDVFEVQEEIAQAVVRALQVRLADGRGPLVRPPTTDLVAHDLYLKGRFMQRRFNPGDLRRAIDYFEQAVARDSNFASAYAAMAISHVSLAIGGDTPTREVRDIALAYAMRAIGLNDRLADTHHAMAYVHYSMQLDVPAAVRDIRRALELEPGHAESTQLYAVFLLTQRHFAEAERYAARAVAADPLMPLALLARGWVYQASGDAARGVPMLREVLDIAPQLTFAREHLVHGLMMLGKHDEALAECRRAVEMGGSRERALLAFVHAELGHRAEALGILEEMFGPEHDQYVPPCHVAYVYAALGETDTAIGWLERAFEEIDTHLNGLAIIRAYDPLRSDPRFVAMLARLKHEPAIVER